MTDYHDFRYGNLPELEELTVEMLRLIEAQAAENGVDVLTAARQQADQLVAHHRAAGWSDIATGAALMLSLTTLNHMDQLSAFLLIVGAVGLKQKETT